MFNSSKQRPSCQQILRTAFKVSIGLGIVVVLLMAIWQEQLGVYIFRRIADNSTRRDTDPQGRRFQLNCAAWQVTTG